MSGAGFGVGAVPFSAAEDAAAGVGGVLIPRARHWSRANGSEWDGTARGPQPALCLFGLRSVAANVTNGTVHCQSPRASDGGGAREETGVDAVRGAVTGAAALHDDGVLRLTDGWPRQAGQYLLPMASPEWPAECEGGGGRFCPTWPTTYFELAFDLLMEGRGGVSVSVGDVPESGLGELGGGVGLRLSFAEGLLRVWHRVELVHEQPLPGYWCQLDVTINPPEQVCRSDADGTFRPASVAWREDGLHVSLGGDDLLVRFPFGWAPLPGWRMALAARTGRGFGRQWVRAVALRTDAAVHHRALPLAVSLNGQQFSDIGADFSWYGHPQPRAVSPACGPLGGGTVVNVTGLAFAGGTSGHSHRCRFGAAGVVDGTVDAGGLLCVSPAATAPAAIGLTVLLVRDGQTLETLPRHAVGFGYVNLTTHGMVPATGPVGGGTRLRIGAAVDGVGCAYRCRWDLGLLRTPPAAARAAVLAGTSAWDPTARYATARYAAAPNSTFGAVTCVVPRVNLTERQLLDRRGADVPVAVSVNAQQFTTLAAPLHVHTAPAVEVSSPSCGPVHGGTAVAILGASLRGGDHYQVRFHRNVVVNATYEDSPQGGIVRCVAPPLPWEAVTVDGLPPVRRSLAVALSVSLNGQQFVAPQAHFAHRLYVEPEPPTVIHPFFWRAGQTVSIYGAEMEGGCDYRCGFGAAGTVKGEFEPARGALRCTAPVGHDWKDPACVAAAEAAAEIANANVSLANCSNVTLSFALDGQAFHDITEATAALDEIHHRQPYYDDDRELKWFDPLAEHENRRRRTAFGERPTVTVDDLFEDGYPDDWV